MFPVEARTKHWMPIHQPLPGATERRCVQYLAQFANQLIDIHAWASIRKRVKQHALLHRRQRIAVFDAYGVVDVLAWHLPSRFLSGRRRDVCHEGGRSGRSCLHASQITGDQLRQQSHREIDQRIAGVRHSRPPCVNGCHCMTFVSRGDILAAASRSEPLGHRSSANWSSGQIKNDLARNLSAINAWCLQPVAVHQTAFDHCRCRQLRWTGGLEDYRPRALTSSAPGQEALGVPAGAPLDVETKAPKGVMNLCQSAVCSTFSRDNISFSGWMFDQMPGKGAGCISRAPSAG